MKLRKFAAVLMVLIMAATVFAGCGSSGDGGKKDDEYGTVVIQNGDRTLTFTSMPTGVLCANLYSAENMVMLGLGEYIVGKNVHTNPAEVPLPELEEYFKDIPEIERSNENAVASGCDLLIGQVSAFKDTAWGTYEQLEAEGIQCLTITGTIVPDETVEDIYTDIRNLGMIFKCEDKAEELIAQMKADIAATQDIVKDVKDEDKPVVFVFDMYKEDQIYTTAAGLESNLIELAGGINATRKMADSRWFYCSVETLVATNPDIIIINDYGSQTVDEKIDYIKSNEACNMIPAVVNDRFLVIPLVDVMQDIRAPRACRTMAEYFYPELFQ
ncbi:MAG: ABC transporter substrate-binding protein [Eubacteriaceae bacterium]|nr:ABC transporter substrate-binding protein [Eubacteriaceae bacterium]